MYKHTALRGLKTYNFPYDTVLFNKSYSLTKA